MILNPLTRTILYLILISSYVVSSDPNPEDQSDYTYQKPTVQGNLDNFAGEKVAVLYRGIHFLNNQFAKNQRQAYIRTSRVNKPMYSPAAYELAGLGYEQIEHPLLDAHSLEVARRINGLNGQAACVVNGRNFKTSRYAFQQLYSNDYKRFFEQLEEPSGDYEDIFNQFDFSRNPLVSLSDRAKHPAKYGFGLKNYGDNEVLLPLYDIHGRPKHPIIGKLYGIVLDEAAVEELMPLNVLRAHNANHIRLQSHFRNDILSEREISIAGGIPADYVVFEMPLQVPSFHGDYPTYYAQKYGLTKARYNNFKRIFTSAATIAQKRADKTRELISGIIEAAYQDNRLIYKNTLSYAIPNLFEETLDHIDANISSITLDYELE